MCISCSSGRRIFQALVAVGEAALDAALQIRQPLFDENGDGGSVRTFQDRLLVHAPRVAENRRVHYVAGIIENDNPPRLIPSQVGVYPETSA